MLELRKYVVPEFIYGQGARRLAGRYARNFGARRTLLVTDPGLIQAGWAADVTASLEAEGQEVFLFSEVTPNPRAESVMAGVDAFLAHGCEVIVALGGGSPIDCAKGISIVSANGGHILSYEGVDRVGSPGAPLICIPTTAGTAADLSQFAIITDTARRTKIAIISKAVVPDVALIDPETTVTMDAYLTVCTGIDALVHAIEAFVSVASSPILDVHAQEAMRLVTAHLPASRERPDNLEIREKVMRASLHAGIAFSNASLGAVHAMAHSLGGFLDRPHGESNALLLEHVVAFNYDSAAAKYDRVGELLGVDLSGMSGPEKSRALCAHLSAFRVRLGVAGGLGERGVRSGDIGLLAENALRDACMVTNPLRPGRRDVEAIYERSL